MPRQQAPVSLKRNLITTYGSQLYMALIGIVILPFYVAVLGVEAYGMVGLYLAMQGWLTLLDFGLSATLSRQAARFRAGAADAAEVRVLLRIVVVIFFGLAVLGSIILASGARLIVKRWLHTETLPDEEAITALRVMAGVLAFRFLAIPLRSFLTGAEDLQWLGLINVTITTTRSVLVLPLMLAVSASLNVFFGWQLVCGVIEVALLGARVGHTIPAGTERNRRGLLLLQEHWGFSLGIAATSAIWIAATNADKVILSGMLPLREYSMFSIATVAAGGVLLIIGPFSLALGPRIVRVHAQGRVDELVRRYNQTTQLTTAAAFPAAIALAFFARQTLWAWTGNSQIAATASTVLSLYALGNGILAIGGLPLQLQIAAGSMKLQVIGTALFAVFFLPLLWWATRMKGMNGAGAAWVTINFLFVVCWVPIVHRRFLPIPHFRWLLQQVLLVVAPTFAVAVLLRGCLPWPSSRWLTLAQLIGIGALLTFVACASAPTLRTYLLTSLRRLIPRN